MSKTIYFDFDGTLHNTLEIYTASVQKAYDHIQGLTPLPNRMIHKEEAKIWLGMPPKDMWNDFLPELEVEYKNLGSTIVGAEMLKALNEGRGQLYPDTIRVLHELKSKGYNLKIISNCKTIYRNKCMDVFNLSLFIDAFYAAEDYDYKPKYEILAEVECDNSVLAFIGDKRSDIEVGKYHDLITIGCCYGYGEPSELMNANYKINDIKELLTLFSD